MNPRRFYAKTILCSIRPESGCNYEHTLAIIIPTLFYKNVLLYPSLLPYTIFYCNDSKLLLGGAQVFRGNFL
jgi:hypothetical protein